MRSAFIGPLILVVCLQTETATVAATPPDDAVEDPVAALIAELQAASRSWVRQFQAATSAEEREQLNQKTPYRLFERRFLELAQTDDAAAIRAVQWLANNAVPGPLLDEGLLLIEQRFLEDDRVAELLSPLEVKSSPGVESFLSAVSTRHPQRAVRGLASLTWAKNLRSQYRTAVYLEDHAESWKQTVAGIYSPEMIAWVEGRDKQQLLKQFDARCASIIQDYADIDDAAWHQATGRHQILAQTAQTLMFSVHAVGRDAPELQGPAADGRSVALSDYQGRVVLLMFSANWCGPCQVMYGQLRELTRLYADKPFTVLTVMADDDISTVQEAVRSGKMTWPAIWDGANGPIAGAWGVSGFPTLYLIGADGRIAAEELRDDALDEAVASMLGVRPEARPRVDKRTRVWTLSLKEKQLKEQDLPQLLEGYTELRELDLSDNALSDEAFRYLLPLQQLESLNLEHTGISDEGLRHLKGLPRLRRLQLYRGPGHRTTTAGRRELSAAIPGLQISFITH